MTDEARHGKQTVDNGIHTPIAYRYANAAARLAETDFDVNDLDKFAVDIDTGDVFRLSNPLGPTWVQVNGTGGGGGSFLPLAGGTMSGTINMNLNAIVGGTYNGVGLTTGGAATDFLNAEGNYITVGNGTIQQINVIGLGLTNPNGPITTIDATALQTATALAQGTADQAILDAANAQSTADSKLASVVSGTDISVDNTDPQNPVINYTGGGTVPGAIQTWPIATARSNQNMSGNVTVGRGYAIGAVAQESTSVNTISFFCAQNPGGGGTNCGVAIYNNLGVRLAYESGITANLGINTIQLTNNTGTPVSVPVNAGSAYYLVIEADINSFSLVARPSYNPPISASVPPISFFIPNSRTVDPIGLPSNISSFFGQVGVGVLNFWLLAYNT